MIRKLEVSKPNDAHIDRTEMPFETIAKLCFMQLCIITFWTAKSQSLANVWCEFLQWKETENTNLDILIFENEI